MMWDKKNPTFLRVSQIWDIFGIYSARLIKWLFRYFLTYLFYGLIILFLLPHSTVQIGDLWQAIAYDISPYQFDYIAWEINALAAKTHQTLFGQHPFMAETARSDFVRRYMSDMQQAQILEAQIAAIYADPDNTDPMTETTALRAKRDTLRENLRTRQLTAEAILEGQVAAVLIDEGFGFAGQLLPPMAMHFTQVPNLLVTSPRDTIALDVSMNLIALPIDQITALENRLDLRYEISSLIVPLGGIALYPAMITEISSIPRAVEVFAHEWLHHYLFAFPLGLHYFTGGEGFASETRIINETTADLFGKEMARLILARYYPDLLPPLPLEIPAGVPQNTEPTAFDFAAAMNETRITVDSLLAEGKIAEAETYMTERREYFYQNGYAFRKLNQAFFAFYGGYQGGSVPGVGGEDPIGPAVQKLWEMSASPHDFVTAIRGITTREALLAAASH